MENILEKVEKLFNMWKKGRLGGEIMPEDENPKLNQDGLENYLYFTLPMALNYQRNSYALWESAKKTFEDKSTNFVFYPKKVLEKSFKEVSFALTKYKLALQKTKQTEIWVKLCRTFVFLFDGDIKQLFKQCNYDVNTIKKFVQIDRKKDFPYLSGAKLCNYWLFVLHQYTDLKLNNIKDLTVAPDTHVIKASFKLGIITKEEMEKSGVQTLVIDRWNKILLSSKFVPIDIHTPLWLWSRNGFLELE